MKTRCPAFRARNSSIAASAWASAPTKLVSAVSRFASNRPVPSGAPLPRPAFTITRSSWPSSASALRNTSNTWS